MELANTIASKKPGVNPENIAGNICMWLESYLGDYYADIDFDKTDISAYADMIEKDMC